MRTFILFVVHAVFLATSLPAWACGMPPMEALQLGDVMAEIDLAGEESVLLRHLQTSEFTGGLSPFEAEAPSGENPSEAPAVKVPDPLVRPSQS